MNYFKKYNQNPAPDLFWNLPEQKQGTINLFGGHANNFRTPVKIAEFLAQSYPLKTVQVYLPDTLKDKLPPLPNFSFLTSTDAGSFKDAAELASAFQTADFNLLLGDFSKNSITGAALAATLSLNNSDPISNLSNNASAVASSGLPLLNPTASLPAATKPLLLTRDTLDLLANFSPEAWLLNPNLILFLSLAQLQKLFRAVYYPKVLTLSASLIQTADALHKFTLSYPVKIISLNSSNLLVAENGNVASAPLEKSGYPPFLLWNGELAAKIAVLNLYNPSNFLNATLSAIFGDALSSITPSNST